VRFGLDSLCKDQATGVCAMRRSGKNLLWRVGEGESGSYWGVWVQDGFRGAVVSHV